MLLRSFYGTHRLVRRFESLLSDNKKYNAEILNYEVSGAKIQSVIMLPGYTHNIINLSDTQDLVTVMYCNERVNPNRPDTYFDPVDKK